MKQLAMEQTQSVPTRLVSAAVLRPMGRSTMPPGSITVNGYTLTWDTKQYTVTVSSKVIKQVSRYIGPRFLHKWVRKYLDRQPTLNQLHLF